MCAVCLTLQNKQNKPFAEDIQRDLPDYIMRNINERLYFYT